MGENVVGGISKPMLGGVKNRDKTEFF